VISKGAKAPGDATPKKEKVESPSFDFEIGGGREKVRQESWKNLKK